MSEFASVFDRARPTGKEPPLNDGIPAPVQEFWARVELMGHRIRYGLCREVEMFGAKLLRVDVTNSIGVTTEFYGGAAIYCLRPITEEEARKYAEPYSAPKPVAIEHKRYQDDSDDDEHIPF